MSYSDPSAVALVERYLQHYEDRDLDGVLSCVSTDFTIEFPGPVLFGSVAHLMHTAAQMFRSLRKHRDHYACGTDDQGRTVVTSRGRLYGECHDGSRIDDVRYCDVFLVADGLIVQQFVFNDMAVAAPGSVLGIDPA
ncbi:nuclear transport factor 2 family protein [Streptosporangium sp. NBC_01755]|uniref:nuclear transport factor 2 family protein n=1 Tax=unclassified Streptosporangium TaxID=2632669 RepID=UPI002DDBE510|nr:MULTISPECIES: nuclear transport factor 2 family protein [unclassified Streptosporangium]WSA28238.1 nuclear transport factor 2 family protein [Streptosporangium sp. NBC_01810]WSD00285.1 nuclear transport factor 2 family protein [Streptosporangium sp. NBC_01755]